MAEKVLIDFQSQIDGINKAITALEKLQRTDKGLHDSFVKNGADMKKTSESVSNSLNSVNNSLRNIAGSVGLAFGVNAMVNYGKEAVNLKAKMESLQNTFNFAFGSAKDGALAMDFVRALSNKLGLELISTAEAFKKFSASANLSGIAATETKKIFTQVSGAVTAMGLSADDANGVFLALSQIISKGTVQAEELRGQIGERLPGAFNLAAKAMGVTTKELNKMLEQGQVLSVDFLPKFAQEMENTFGSAIPAAMESTQAKLNRLENAFTDFKNTLGVIIADSGIVDFFATIGKGISQATSKLGLEGSIIDEEAAKRAADVIKEVEFSAKKLGNTFELQASERIYNNLILLDQNKQDIKELEEKNKLLKSSVTTSAQADEIKENTELINLLKIVNATKEKEIPILEEAVKGQQKKIETVRELTKEEQKAIKEEEAAIKQLEQLKIKNIQNEQERLIAEAEFEIKNLKGSKQTQAELEKEIRVKLLRDLLQIERDYQEELNKEIEKITEDKKKKNEDITKDFRKQLNDSISEVDEIEKQNEKDEKEKEEKAKAEKEDIRQAEFELAQEAFNGLAELANAHRDHDIAVAKELLDAKIITEEEYNSRVKKIKREQAVIDKAQALFNIGIQTAENIVKAALNPVLLALAISIGVVQAGVVLAKPIPFNKGTKRVPGIDTGVDSVHAIVRPGEKIFTTERSREYEPILDAIFDAKLPSAFLNKIAKGEAVGGISIDEYAIKRGFEGALRNGVYIKNFPKNNDGVSYSELEFMKKRGLL